MKPTVSYGLFSLVKSLVVLSALGLITPHTFAQYIWLDENGTKQYSDMAPPVTTPINRILKTPVVKKIEVTSASSPASGSAPAQSGASTPVTTADKDAEFQKKKIEQAELDKKNSEEKKQAESKKRNCEKASEYQRTLNSGIRISHIDKNGERSYLDDAQRVKEVKENNAALSDCK